MKKLSEAEINKLKLGIIEDLSSALDGINGDVYSVEIINVDTEKGTVDIRFPYHIVEDDDYYGLVGY